MYDDAMPISDNIYTESMLTGCGEKVAEMNTTYQTLAGNSAS